MSSKKSKETRITVTLRATEGTLRGKLIDYLRSHPDGTSNAIEETLLARFKPLLLERDDDNYDFRKEAIQSITKLQGYCNAIECCCGVKVERVLISTAVTVNPETVESSETVSIFEILDDVLDDENGKADDKRDKKYSDFLDEMSNIEF